MPEQRYTALKGKFSKKHHPIDRSWLFSILTFSWITPYITLSKKTRFEQTDHPGMSKKDNLTKTANSIKNQLTRGHSLSFSIVASFKWLLLWTLALTIFEVFCYNLSVYVTTDFIRIISKQHKEQGKIHEYPKLLGYGALIIFMQALSVILTNYVNFTRSRLGLNVKLGLAELIFQKISKLALADSRSVTEGFIVNLIQSDCEKIEFAVLDFNTLIRSGITGIFAVGLGILLFGVEFLLFLLGIFITGVLIGIIYYFYASLRKKLLEAKDTRVSFLKGIINNLLFIKSRGWENFYYYKITSLRLAELRFLKIWASLSVIRTFLCWNGPLFSFCLFLYYYIQSGDLEVETMTPLLNIFFMIVVACVTIPQSGQTVLDLKVSLKRLQRFLLLKELNYESLKAPLQDHERANVGIAVENGNFSWRRYPQLGSKKRRMSLSERGRRNRLSRGQGDQKTVLSQPLLNPEDAMVQSEIEITTVVTALSTYQKLTQEEKELSLERHGKLREINFEAPKGKRTFIIGQIGSGKSSLLYSLFGEMQTVEGSQVRFEEKIAFLGQKPWILNGTVKYNIILGKDLDEERLNWAVKYSALGDDLKTFEKGLDQIIGESGNTISGGQKARLALARALYQE